MHHPASGACTGPGHPGFGLQCSLTRRRISAVLLSPPALKPLLKMVFNLCRQIPGTLGGRLVRRGPQARAQQIREGLAGFLVFCVCVGLPGIAQGTSAPSQAELPGYFTRVLRTSDGLPHNAVTAIVQTRDDYLWLGTYDGLARFDGNTFSVFDSNNSKTPEMRSSRVVSLFEDDYGTLWIGHETGELTRYRNGHFQPVQFHAGPEDRKILAISADETGKTWLLFENGVLASVKGERVVIPNAVAAAKTSALARSPSGKLWVLFNGAVYTLQQDRLIPLASDSEALGGYVTGICAARDGGLWIVSGGEVRKWNGSQLTEDLGPSPWGQHSPTTIIETRSGALAVGTLDKGLYLLFPHRGVLHFDRANGFPHDWVRSLCNDREGTLWVGTGSGGLVALRASKVTTLNAPDHWQGMVVLSVCAASNGALWVGTEGAGLYRLLDGQWSHFGESNGLSNLFVWSVSEDAQGRLWAGTWGDGVFVQQGNRFVHPSGLESTPVAAPALLHAGDGVTWIGTDTGLLRYQSGRITSYGQKQGLTRPDVRAIVQDQDGTIWFGMMGGGLGRLRQGEVKQFKESDGLSSDDVQCLYLDTDGSLWIGTYGGGLNRMKQGQFAGINSSQGLPNNFICGIQGDGRGNLWLSSHGGIFRIQRQELNRCADGKTASFHCLSYGIGDGMPTAECSGGLQPSVCRTADGRLWIPTSNGLVGVDPANVKTNQLPPPVVIEQMLVNSKPITNAFDPTLPVRIPPGSERFEFRYTALTFVASRKVRFQYRLEGREPDWIDAGTKRSINYSYIPSGTYTFHVIACNSDGIWNTKGASLTFTVKPHFWQTWWFRSLAGLVAAGLLAGSVLMATRRRMRRKFERLERQQAIERERSRIAQDIHDNLGASLTRISLLSQSAHSELDNLEHAATQLDRIYDTAHELTRALDEIVWAVNPQHDTLDSLANYLGKFAQDFLGPLQIRCRLDMPVQLPTWRITAEVRHNLFLAFKEALHNVVRHAKASEVSIVLHIEPEAFALVVRDNGIGFTPDNAMQNSPGEPGRLARGNGLANMRRRLQKLGGHCEIQSTSGQGAEVSFVVPVKFHSS